MSTHETSLPDDEAIGLALRRGELADNTFDTLYSAAVQKHSSRFWTPLSVASRVAAILEKAAVRRVVDAGSGPGKFCIAAGAAAPRIHFDGVEHRADLVEQARSVAARLSVDNVRFSLADASSLLFDDFDAIYFFNPFAENVYSREDERFDTTVPLSPERFLADVMKAERALESAKHGFILVTYFGFGGRIPGNYDLVHAERAGTDWLRVWHKQRESASSRYHLELDNGVVLVRATPVR